MLIKYDSISYFTSIKSFKTSELSEIQKKGKVVYYSLNDEHVKQILEQGLIHINE